jgi:hypothetical protein
LISRQTADSFSKGLDPAGPDCGHSAQYYYKRKAECCVLEAPIYILCLLLYLLQTLREKNERRKREKDMYAAAAAVI